MSGACLTKKLGKHRSGFFFKEKKTSWKYPPVIFNKRVSGDWVNIWSHCGNTALKIYMEVNVMTQTNRGFYVYVVTQEVHSRGPFRTPITYTRNNADKSVTKLQLSVLHIQVKSQNKVSWNYK